jgi:hypothetical protein
MSKDTPQKARVSNHASANYTHASVDKFLREDLDGLTRRNVSLDDFLKNVLGFDNVKWNKDLSNWKLHETDTYRVCLKEYLEGMRKGEIKGYSPFKKWSEYILTEVKSKSPEVASKVNLELHSLGSTVLGGDFGRRQPDIAASNEGFKSLELRWDDTLLVFELKKKADKSGVKRKCIADAGSKRAKYGSKTGSNKVPATSRRTGSNALKGKRLITSRNASNSNSKTRAAPAAPGFNREDSPSPSPSNSHTPTSLPQQNAPNASDIAGNVEPEASGSMLNLLADKSTDSEIQLANYATQMLCCREFRQWTVSILIEEEKMFLWYYDRSHAFCTSKININEDAISFIKVILALALCSGDKTKLGFSNLYKRPAGGDAKDMIRYIDGSEFSVFEEPPNKRGLVAPPENSIPKFDLLENQKIFFDLNDLIHQQYTLFGRATKVEDAKVGIEDNGVLIPISGKDKFVLKVSYQVTTRVPEHKIIRHARQINPVHTPAVVAYRIIKDDLPGHYLENAIDSQRPLDDAYEERQLVLMIMRKYENVWNLEADDLMDVFRQGVHCMLYFFT